MIVIEGEEWRALALCRDMEPAIFYPTDLGGVNAAIEICKGCPVKKACLDFALATRQEDGVWGGTSERERVRLRRAARYQ